MLLLQQMVIFFLIMLIGYICRKVGVFGENTGKMISGIVINIGNPALIIASGMNPETLENKAALLVTLAVALIFFAIMFVIAELIPRLLRILEPAEPDQKRHEHHAAARTEKSVDKACQRTCQQAEADARLCIFPHLKTPFPWHSLP